jgi:hypothetical protein
MNVIQHNDTQHNVMLIAAFLLLCSVIIHGVVVPINLLSVLSYIVLKHLGKMVRVSKCSQKFLIPN